MTAAGGIGALLVVLITGIVVAAVGGPVLRRLPEPDPPPEVVERDVAGQTAHESEPPKTPYRALARPAFLIMVGLLAMAGTAVVVLTLPFRFWPPWLVLSSIGVLLAAIDARTTWLPWRLTWSGWLAMLAAGAVAVLLGTGWFELVRMVGSGLVAGLWYVLIYLLTRRRLGLGDVWLAPLVGAPAGLVSFTHLYAALLLGSVAGGLHGLVLLVFGHRGAFPYGPAIVAGPFLALVVLALVT